MQKALTKNVITDLIDDIFALIRCTALCFCANVHLVKRPVVEAVAEFVNQVAKVHCILQRVIVRVTIRKRIHRSTTRLMHQPNLLRRLPGRGPVQILEEFEN